MKIVVLYGPGEVGKRTELLRLKKGFPKEAVFQVDLKHAALDHLVTLFTSNSLFDFGPRCIILENASEKLDLLSLMRPTEDLMVLLAGSLKDDSLLLQTAKKTGAKVCSFEGEKELTAFPFLDGLFEGKAVAFTELSKLLAGYGFMYVLTMIYYGLRRNLLPLPTSSFAASKIKLQKVKYSLNDWERFYKMALQTEFGIKSGILVESTALNKLVHLIKNG